MKKLLFLIATFQLMIFSSLSFAGEANQIHCEGVANSGPQAGQGIIFDLHLNHQEIYPAYSDLFIQVGNQEIVRTLKVVVSFSNPDTEMGRVFRWSAKLDGKSAYLSTQFRNLVKGVGAIQLENGTRAGLMGCKIK